MKEPEGDEAQAPDERELPQYEPPCITVMDEKEVLRTFQVTHAGLTWWVM